MTLNFSHRTYFPVNPSEDDLVSSVRDRYVIEGMSEKYGSAYGNPQCFDWEFGNSFDCGKDGVEKSGSFESVTNDIDLLPSDPFGMEISATFTAFAGWVEEPDRLNIMWNRTLTFQTQSGNKEVYEISNPSCGFDGNMGESRKGSRQDGFAVIHNAEKLLSFKNENMCVVSQQYKESGKGTGTWSGADEGAPNDALLFALGYLGVRDLLAVERVCRSLRSASQSDVLLWKSIHIDQQLSARITDDALLSLTNRAQANLQCLSLVGCSRITDSGLKGVLECNPRLTKLNVTGCIGLSVDGIVDNLKAFKSSGTSGINHLRIGGRYGVTREHFEELKSLVGAEECVQAKANNKPHYYHHGHSTAFVDDDRAIDIEICPRCENLRLVFDCPSESCQQKQPGAQTCRACIICIPRCGECGSCLNGREYEETFFLYAHCFCL